MFMTLSHTLIGLSVLAGGVLVGVPIISLVYTLFLRLAVWVARLPGVSFGRAYLAALVANYVLLALSVTFWVHAAFFVSLNDDDSPISIYRFWFSPDTYFYYVSGLVLMHATIFSQMLADRDHPLRFGKASLVALIYIAIAFVVASFAVFLSALMTATGVMTR